MHKSILLHLVWFIFHSDLLIKLLNKILTIGFKLAILKFISERVQILNS